MTRSGGENVSYCKYCGEEISWMRGLLPVAALRNLQMIEQVVERAVWSELAAETEYHEAFQNVKAKVQQVAALALALVPERAVLSDSA